MTDPKPFLRCYRHLFPERAAYAKANLVARFGWRLGFASHIEYFEEPQPNYAVFINCTEEQEKQIFNHPGMPLREINSICAASSNVDFRQIYFWLPVDLEPYWDHLLNPTAKPVDSADGRDHCEAQNYYLTKP